VSTLHIVQGGVENGDKKWLEKASRLKLKSPSWVVPKSADLGDEIVIFVRPYGFFATARIASAPKPRPDWPNRYGASLSSIRLIKPAISLAAIRREVPELTWSVYPRSITTPPPKVAAKVQALITKRRQTGLPDLDDAALEAANIDELRKVALLKARSVVPASQRGARYRARSLAISLYVLQRADGKCESCGNQAPFSRPNGSPYLEPHHTTRLADDGPDHRRAHSADDAKVFNSSLKKRVCDIERRMTS